MLTAFGLVTGGVVVAGAVPVTGAVPLEGGGAHRDAAGAGVVATAVDCAAEPVALAPTVVPKLTVQAGTKASPKTKTRRSDIFSPCRVGRRVTDFASHGTTVSGLHGASLRAK